METKDILKYVDHTLLAQTAKWDDIKALIDDGIKYETASVPGMNGDILYSNGRLKNGTLPYNCWIADDYVANARNLRNFLLSVEGYGRLEDTRHPEEFRKAFFRGPQNFDDVVSYTAGKFTINFEVKPQRWLKSTITQNNLCAIAS